MLWQFVFVSLHVRAIGADQGESLGCPFRVGCRELSLIILVGLDPSGSNLHACTLCLVAVVVGVKRCTS